MVKFSNSLGGGECQGGVVGMIIRGGSNVSLQQIADAIIAGEQVVIARKLDQAAVICLEEELERLTNLCISLNWSRGRYLVHSQQFNETEKHDDNDFDGHWTQIQQSEIELAVALA